MTKQKQQGTRRRTVFMLAAAGVSLTLAVGAPLTVTVLALLMSPLTVRPGSRE